MRVLLGLAALAATATAQTTVTPTTTTGGSASQVAVGNTALASISIYQQTNSNQITTFSPTGLNTGNFINSNNFVINVLNPITQVYFAFVTNGYTAQVQYRWYPNYPNPAAAYPSYNLSPQSYTCDPCAGSTPVSCNTGAGPVPSSPQGANGANCAFLSRTYLMTNLVASTNGATAFPNAFAVQLFDRIQQPGPDTTSYSFTIYRAASAIIGDPQIVGLQGQDFQVHGMPDEIFNMITYPNLQVNARFVYLSSGACHDNFTACFAHPGTYISEEGIRLGSDKIHVQAGSFKKGLTVSVNGKKISEKKTAVKLGSVELVNHRRVVVTTPIMSIVISNSDKFLNQETQLSDRKLLSLGAQRRSLLVGESFHPEVPLHGLQGQTWRNVEYPSGLEYEGSISDYHVTDGNLYGSKFVFNQYKH